MGSALLSANFSRPGRLLCVLQEHNKKQILKQFDLRPVTAPKDPRKVAKGVSAPDAFIGKEAEAQKKVRGSKGAIVDMGVDMAHVTYHGS